MRPREVKGLPQGHSQGSGQSSSLLPVSEHWSFRVHLSRSTLMEHLSLATQWLSIWGDSELKEKQLQLAGHSHCKGQMVSFPASCDEGPTWQGLSKKLRPTCAGCGGGGHGEGVHSDELRKVPGKGWHWLGLQRPNGLGVMGRG